MSGLARALQCDRGGATKMSHPSLRCLLTISALATAPLFVGCGAERDATASADDNLTQSGAAPTQVPRFKKVVVVFFENDDEKNALQFPFFQSVAKRGALLTNYRGVTHPSEPNYIAFAAGTLDYRGVAIAVGGDAVAGGGMIDDDVQYDLPGRHLGDLLEAKNLSWKNYAEDYPGTDSKCFTGSHDKTADGSAGKYARRHTPFMSFTNVSTSNSRCTKHITNASAFEKDLANGALPAFSFFTPNLIDDGHDSSTEAADQWFKQTFGPLLDDPKFADVLLVATFDENSCNTIGAGDTPEDDAKKARCVGDQNVVYTAFVGNGVKPGSSSDVRYDHYSLLKTVELGLDLGDLGKNDASAVPITGIWQ
jgi:Phosphoesterase family